MPATAYVARILDQLSSHPVPEGVDRDLFVAFVRALGRQLRPPYQTRFGAGDVLSHLLELYSKALHLGGGEITVRSSFDEGSAVFLTVMKDQPFIVDTILLVLRRRGLEYLGGFNVILQASRDASGKLVAVGAEGGRAESLVRAEVDGVTEAELPAIEAEIRRALTLSRATVNGFGAMTELVESNAWRLARLADRMPDQAESLREGAEFLRWLLTDNFVFMGAQFADQRLGIAEEAVAHAGGLPVDALTAGWEAPALPLPVQVRKSQVESPVHRAGRLDEIRIEVRTENGDEVRALYVQGLFTYKAMTQASRNVPVLRQILARILAREEARPGSFRYRGLANAFDSLPTEFLFTATPDEIMGMIDRVLEAEQERRVRVYLLQKPGKAMAYALVAMPKGRWSDKMRAEIEGALVSTLRGSYSDHGVFVGRYDTMLLHFYLTGVQTLDEAQHQELVERVSDLATPWADRLYDALLAAHGEERADELVVRYGTAFDESYQGRTTLDRTLRDIAMLEQLGQDRAALCDLYQDEQGGLNLRIYQRTDIILSDILPVLDNAGLVVIAEHDDAVHPRHGASVMLDTFRIKEVSGVSVEQVLERRQLLVEGLQAVFTQKIPNDVLNRLILRAGLSWQAVDALRGYNGFARQLGQRYTLARVAEILGDRPDLLQLLWACFEARFNPAGGEGREARFQAASDAFLDALRSVTDVDQDGTFRNLHNLIESTLRTNFYRARPFHYISLKFDCALVRAMPSPKMRKEIYVHHREVEGVHLRGGPIARGGIRWSDREDFRREILGLVSTQMVKNVLIVPEGSKGGFFLKNPAIRDGRELRRKADELYKVLIRGMLDVTDNYVAGEVVPPPDVVRWDENDPYLVVAADKGTAHLSDTANGLSKEYGFWLGDAFASGGSNGYDHKVVGITARGAWVLAKRHFREMGRDPYKDEFTAVGVGDTSGDVFGNGVIESPKMKLLAAFNHLHVFLDPNPDPQKSYEERLRLFREVKGWDHYNQELISQGGGIYSRKAKAIPLSPEVQRMLGVLKPELPVDDVIRLILRMDVDMLLNGGIGTYVKSSFESHQDAGDATNDNLRVNANELRCRMAFEGGNLGFTQAARIEYAQRGGRINNDAVDNSGGVDLSDHEVNLKILLNPMVAAGRLSLDERNTLLESMTEEVAQSVLANNDRHGRQLSLDQVRSARDPMQYARVIDWVTARGGRSRAELVLPSDEDLARRGAVGQGLTRPELAVLQANVKMHVKKILLSADPEPIPGFGDIVLRYFPKTVQERYRDDIPRHMLHRNIGMTSVLMHVAGEGGLALFPTMMELTGANPAVIAGAWLHAMDLVGGDEIMAELRACDASVDSKYQAWVDLNDQVQALVALWLAPGEPGPWKEDKAAIAGVLARVAGNRAAAMEERARARADQYVGIKVPASTAARIVALEDLVTAREIALLGGKEAGGTAGVVRYLAVGEASRILPALRALSVRKTHGRWDAIAMGILKNRFLALLRQMVDGLDLGSRAQIGVDRVAFQLQKGPLGALQAEMDRVLGDQPDVATLLVAEERIRGFVARTKLKDVAWV